LLIERAAIAAIAVIFLGWCAYTRTSDARAFILVDGKPVVCVSSERDAQAVLGKIKSSTGCDPAEIEFKQDVVIARAPRDANPVSRHMAMRVVGGAVQPVFERWAVLADGKPVVAVPSRTMAAEVLELAKLKFGQKVTNLAEEPQFKQSVTVQTVPVSPSIYRKSAREAVKFIFEEGPRTTTEGYYTVKRGDLAGEIAARHHLKLAQLWGINPGVNLNRLRIGDKIKVSKTESAKPKLVVVVRDQSDVVESIRPPLQRVSSTRMYAGKVAEISPGAWGKRQATVATLYENGRRVGREIIHEEIIREPVPRRIAVGIKPRM